ncbi:MAG: hypothetical protein CL944_02310 [Candidatus Diapherotrites archaeon]|uniref:S-layer protein n=1 Tax=Candidatus Iainarchaeum sp. TaxID=3101447 RepID=A0A2D6LQ53_9ARCH|nr:hypothetical protein [Candidatus Diapherotrites archaeon]
MFVQPAFAGQLLILDVSTHTSIPSTIYAGDLVAVNVNIDNLSGVGQAANDIHVSLQLNENDFEIIDVEENIDSIKAKGSKTVSVRFRVKEGTLPGVYKLPVSMDYFSGTDKLNQVDTIDLLITSCNTLNISEIDLSNFKPHINDSLVVTANIENNCSTAARDVEISLLPVTNTTIDPFIVAADSIKIGDILPGEEQKARFNLQITNKVDTQTYVFSIDANCDSCKTASNSFSFQVLGRPELVFSNIEYSVENALGNDSQIMQGSLFTFSVQLDNIGEEKAKAVSISVDFDEAIVGTSKSFLGNIDPDDSGAAIFNLSTAFDANPGETPGTITVNYIDELGVEQSFTENYPLYINAAPPTSPIVWIFLLILIIVVLALVYFIIKFVFRQLALRKAQSR